MQSSRKEQGQFHKKPNVALRLAAILLVMVCLSIWLMNGLFAKYRTSDEGSDSARVIKFGEISLTETGDFDGVNGGKAFLIPGVNLEKKVEVKFTGSESATYVFVKVELPAHWSSIDNKTFSAFYNRVKWEVADEWTFLQISAETSTEFIYYQAVAPNDTFEADFIKKGEITVSDSFTKKEMNEISNLANKLEIKFTAYVVQSNGFTGQTEPERAQAAWASIAN